MNMKIVIACALSLLAEGCVSIPGTGISSATDIARDAAALNDAYSRAASNQILLNTLRARDRWPRQYVSLNGVTNNPTSRATGGINLDPFPLNNPGDNFGSSHLELSREQSSTYSYGISPLTTDIINHAVLTPVSRDVFEHYWDSSWPRDVLMLVMAANIHRYTGTGEVTRAELQNLIKGDPTERLWSPVMFNGPIDDDVDNGAPCTDDAAFEPSTAWPENAGDDALTRAGARTEHDRLTVDHDVHLRADRHATLQPIAWPTDRTLQRCAFFRVMHRMFVRWSVRREDVTLQEIPTAGCRDSQPVDVSNSERIRAFYVAASASNGRLIIRQATNADGSRDPNRLVLAQCPEHAAEPILLQVRDRDHVQATYLVTLRSLDDMIYSMGTLLRPMQHANGQTPEVRNLSIPLVRAHCTAAAIANHATCVTAPLFAVTTRGLIGSPNEFAAYVDFRGERYVAGPSARLPEDGDDRTGTVLTLLSQLFALAYSPGGGDASQPVRAIVVN